MKLQVVTLLTALALLAAACGGSDAGTTTTTTGETTTTAEATTTTAETAETTTTAASAEAPMIPADHEGRNECFACHAEGVAGAPKVPTEPDHSQLTDERAVCSACHQEAG